MKPDTLYHGSSRRVEMLVPVLEQRTAEHVHAKAAVFATERKDLAALFMFPLEKLASIGFEEGVAYICIWGTLEELASEMPKGYLYTLPSDSFEKIGKDYEWQSFQEVTPLEVQEHQSVVDGMIECGVQVYFINDEAVFDKIIKEPLRKKILKDLASENRKRTEKGSGVL